MELNLKKARSLASKIESLANSKSVDLDTHINIRVNEDLTKLDEIREEAKSKFENEFHLIDKLLAIRQDIRDKVRTKNYECGIDDMISKKNLIESKLRLANKFSDVNTSHPGQVFDKQFIEDNIDYSKRLLENGERASTVQRIEVLKKEDYKAIDDFKHQLVKELEDTEDRLTELNFTNKIVIEEDVVSLLQDNHLL